MPRNFFGGQDYKKIQDPTFAPEDVKTGKKKQLDPARMAAVKNRMKKLRPSSSADEEDKKVKNMGY